MDPASGSGSFLISACQYLLDRHLGRYLESDPSAFPDELHHDTDGEWRLSTKERKRILLSSIFGVDIDRQAVEVTKLSLMLKVLEGETQETINETRRLF